MRRWILLILMYLYAAGISAQQFGFQIEGNQNKVVIPFKLHNNLIVIPVILNDQLPLKFILDTGVRTTILVDKDYSDLLNLEYIKKYTFTGLGDKKVVEAFITPNVSISISGVRGDGHAMLVLEKDLMELKNYLGTDVHGVLGYELFSRFIVKIDYSNETLTLMQPSAFHPGEKYTVLDMVVEDTKPHIMTVIEQDDGTCVNLKLMIDTGSSQSLFIERESDPDNIFLPDKTIHSNVGRGLAGAITGEVGRIPSFVIGDYLLKDVIVNYPDYSEEVYGLITVDRNGTLGGEILSRFNVVFDFPEEKLYIRKNSFYRKDFSYNLSGLTIKAVGTKLNSFVITDVRKGSSGYEAGFKVDDVIISVNGLKQDDLRMDNILGMLNSKSGRKVRMIVKRGEKILKINIELEDLI